MADVVLTWERFETFRQARKRFRQRPCIYVLVAEDGELLYLGESGDLWERYKGGTGSMVDAALNGTNKITYVADAPADERERKSIEGSLTYKYKPESTASRTNGQGPLVPLRSSIAAMCRSGWSDAR